MKANRITIKQTIFINKEKVKVWEFTQNFENRIKWDSAVKEAVVLQSEPNRIVKLKMKWNNTMVYVYKLDDKPNKQAWPLLSFNHH